MSEAAPEAVAPETTAPAPEAAPEQPAQALTQEQVNALLAEQKRKLREQYAGFDELKAKAEQFDAAQEAAKTEQQRAAEAAAKAQQEAQEARAESLRYKAAATHGIGQDYFDLLGSGDEEAISARAERLGALLQTASEVERLRAENEALRAGKPVPTSGRPIEALRPGATPTSAQNEDDVLYNSLFGG